ncbi:hypothetical protein [Actinacidiphila oryziradicis]|uniref:Uncharacterized protein n=1 Tax=Actinacidiphila oryziradicis TaxID=2571141 RepID=A0A4U0S6U6_9ACTN|nr:hypothetical protein [Actinacidiphila oryziradicis]TKA04840.1 hypothetical protein FCI23_34295 [Actinacidiphila oryziradicis]
MRLGTLVIDAWSWLNYKPVMADPDRPANSRAFPELAGWWVPAADMPRLAAYKLLAAYDNNQAGRRVRRSPRQRLQFDGGLGRCRVVSGL